MFLNIWSSTPSLSHLIVAAEGGVKPAIYWYSLENESLIKLAESSLGADTQTQHVTYAARDGLKIPAYLTLPGPTAEGPYAAIMYPHGGPLAEDVGRFDFLTEFFVDRGYAVLQPNFRGSTGYGDDYTRAGFTEWGGKMQDDLTDGLDWMIAQGYTDPDRVCIHGASYGGYAALVAAYKTPEKYKCAASFAGVTDLEGLRDRLYLGVFGLLITARLPTGEALTKNSPLANANQLALPLLIVHGDVDRSVMIEQSHKLVAELQTLGKKYTYIEQPNGDHHFSLQSHRLQYLTALDEFLAKHLN